jgi:alkylation response protein AidB-like acyl-CoA dehydrogenase
VALAATEEHEELRKTVGRWAESRNLRSAARQAADHDWPRLPSQWKELGSQGWLGLHVPEAQGGQGFGVMELAVVAEELAYHLLPGPFLPTVVATYVISRYGSERLRAHWLQAMCGGFATAGLALGGDRAEVSSGGSRLFGTVLGAPGADLLLLPAGDGMVVVESRSAGVEVVPRRGTDPTCPLGRASISDSVLYDAEVLSGARQVADLLALVVACAEVAGCARWCMDTAAEYAKNRVQFGRPIGQFQAVKHRIADMVVLVEQAEAVAWDAAAAFDELVRDKAVDDELKLAVSVAGSISLDAAVTCAKSCVQVLGGIGFTWEHDAHLYLKRSLGIRQLFATTGHLARQVSDLAIAGTRRRLTISLPTGTDALREEVDRLVQGASLLQGAERRAYLVDNGMVMPHWPIPYGREASPLEQIVLDAAMREAKVRRPHLGVGAWVLPTLIAHANQEQKDRWVRPTLMGEIQWCQLFSEPSAGSDLAALTTRAEKVEGGWTITGQKVWTSMASVADLGVCLARTDPAAPKHDGIGYFVVDMHSPGVEVRPLREMTGESLFSEVFLTDVFVGDDALVGSPTSGWSIARTTLSNERVSMSSGATFGTGVEALLALAFPGSLDADTSTRLGKLLAEAQSIRLLSQRDLLRSLAGGDASVSASIRKLLAAEHEQRVQEFGLELCGPEGAAADGAAEGWVRGFMVTRCLTIAGGTSEIQRNLLAERALGLPRDPEPRD